MSLSRILGSAASRDFLHPSSRLLRLFDDPFFAQPFQTPLASTLSQTAFTRTPTFDVKETEKEFVLQGELPGVESKNLSLEFVDPQTLSIRGVVEKSQEITEPPAATNASTEVVKSETEVDKPTYWASERVYGEFSRAFRFPAKVDSEHVAASLKNGILNVTVPKLGEVPSRKIEVVSE